MADALIAVLADVVSWGDANLSLYGNADMATVSTPPSRRAEACFLADIAFIDRDDPLHEPPALRAHASDTDQV